jgi:hypothetical protein
MGAVGEDLDDQRDDDEKTPAWAWPTPERLDARERSESHPLSVARAAAENASCPTRPWRTTRCRD